MPYHLIERGSQTCVAKEGEQTPIPGGCHASAAEAKKHLAALYAQVPEARGGSVFKTYKSSNGAVRWVMLTSNPYRDRDKQFVTLKALQNDVALNPTNRGPLRWWHVGSPQWDDLDDWRTVKAGPGIDLGTCDFACMMDRILVESGTFYKDSIGQRFAELAPLLGGSAGFSHPPTRPRADGAFPEIHIFERSLTPARAASNPFTQFLARRTPMPMTDAERADRIAALKALGLSPDDVTELVTQVKDVQDRADQTAPWVEKTVQTQQDQEQVRVPLTEKCDPAVTLPILDALAQQVAQLRSALQADMEAEEKAKKAPKKDEAPAGNSSANPVFTPEAFKAAMSEALGPVIEEMSNNRKAMTALKDMLSGGGRDEEKAKKDKPAAAPAATEKAVSNGNGMHSGNVQRDNDLATTLKTIQASIDELSGMQPRAVATRGYDPTSDPATVAATYKDAVPANPIQWLDGFVTRTPGR